MRKKDPKIKLLGSMPNGPTYLVEIPHTNWQSRFFKVRVEVRPAGIVVKNELTRKEVDVVIREEIIRILKREGYLE